MGGRAKTGEKELVIRRVVLHQVASFSISRDKFARRSEISSSSSSSVISLHFFLARLSRKVIGWPWLKGSGPEKRVEKLFPRGRLGRTSYCAKFACACLSDRHLVSYCALPCTLCNTVQCAETLRV